MRRFALAAAIILACGGGATGSPLTPNPSGMSAFARGDIHFARWRHRHNRGDWPGERGAEGADRDDTNGFSGVIRLLFPEIARPAPRRRRGWVDPPPLE
jgi:hypothetical protein